MGDIMKHNQVFFTQNAGRSQYYGFSLTDKWTQVSIPMAILVLLIILSRISLTKIYTRMSAIRIIFLQQQLVAVFARCQSAFLFKTL